MARHRGEFDLSRNPLAEYRDPGWRNKMTLDSIPCNIIF